MSEIKGVSFSELEKTFESAEIRYDVWNPQKSGDMMGGTIIGVKDFPQRYQGSILITIERYDGSGGISWWLPTVAKYKLADMSRLQYTRGNFQSEVTAVKMMMGRGIAVRYDGMNEGAKYSYKMFTIVDAKQWDRNESDIQKNGGGNFF